MNIREAYRLHGSSLSNAAFWAIAVYRFGVWCEKQTGLWRSLLILIYNRISSLTGLITGVHLDRRTRIGAGFHIIHAGAIRIHPDVVIGDRVGIMHGTTLGLNIGREGAPKIGNDVLISTGATILGPVEIGDGAMIAANSLVVSNIPAHATAIGVPARIMPSSKGAPTREASDAASAGTPRQQRRQASGTAKPDPT